MGVVCVVATIIAVLLLTWIVSGWSPKAAYALLQHSQYLFEPEDIVEPDKKRGVSVRKKQRGYLSPYMKKMIAFKQDWKCSCGCGASLQPDFHIDHRTPLWRGGRDSIDNMTAMNPACHTKKTSIENQLGS